VTATRSGRPLEGTLQARRTAGRRLLVPYVTAGLVPGWTELVEAVVAGGADAVEIGIPFSDPIMDGPVIQEASRRALEAGTTPAAVLDAVRDLEVDVPLVAMTYTNLVVRYGLGRFAADLAEVGITGAILPDLALEESGPWREEAESHGVDAVLLVAPTTPPARRAALAGATRGFLYVMGLMGVTGERPTLAARGLELARECRPLTTRPVLVGVGVSTPEQASEVGRHADGAIVGSAIVRRVLDGARPAELEALVARLRRGLDQLGADEAPTPPDPSRPRGVPGALS
jgi:tryptophan synthase alpha chain